MTRSRPLLVSGIQASTVEALADGLVREARAATPPVEPVGYFARPLSVDELRALCQRVLSILDESGSETEQS